MADPKQPTAKPPEAPKSEQLKQYRAKARLFVNKRLIEPGELFMGRPSQKGSQWAEVTAEPAAAPAPAGPGGATRLSDQEP